MLFNLTQQKRDELFQSLTEDQKSYLHNRLRRGKRTIFAISMAKKKGHHIPEGIDEREIETLLEDWILIDFIDAGFVTSALKCECGRSLRYQYIVENKKTKERLKFGRDHFEMHTGIDAAIVKEILKGFDAIDLELDEILIKITENWDLKKIIQIPEDFQIPLDIQEHLELELPLLYKQLNRLRSLIERHEMKPKKISTIKNENTHTYKEPHTYSYSNATQQDDLFKNIYVGHVNCEYKEFIDIYLQQEIRSARIMCELLIKNNNAKKKRYLSGKPHIYVDVCIYLESLVSNGYCRLISKNKNDRIYQLI